MKKNDRTATGSATGTQQVTQQVKNARNPEKTASATGATGNIHFLMLRRIKNKYHE
jgi:hypothetical protein